MAGEFCPNCGTARIGAFRFCRTCQYDFEAAAPAGTMQQAAASVGAPPPGQGRGAAPVPVPAPTPVVPSGTPAAQPSPSRGGGFGKWWASRSRRTRWIVVAVVVLLALGVVGDLTGSNRSAGASGASSGPSAAVVSQAPAAAAPATPAVPATTPVAVAAPQVTQNEGGAPAPPAPGATPTILLKLSGNGINTSKPFSATGDSFTMTYAYDCTSFGYAGNFVVDVYGTNALDPALPDGAVNELGMKGGPTTTTVYLNGQPGPFHIEVNSECSWGVIVYGTPK